MSLIGISQLTIQFTFLDLLPPDSAAAEYFKIDKKYLNTGLTIDSYVENAEIDYSSHEVQLQMQTFNDKLLRCYGCEQSWFLKNSLQNWYQAYLSWVDRENCFLLPKGLKPFEKTIPSEQFYVCLQTFLTTTEGNNYKDTIRFTDEANKSDRKIIGFVNRIGVR